jgi:hypothetical protein
LRPKERVVGAGTIGQPARLLLLVDDAAHQPAQLATLAVLIRANLLHCRSRSESCAAIEPADASGEEDQTVADPAPAMTTIKRS